MTDPLTALTALITEHSGLTGVRAGRLARRIAAEWPAAQVAAETRWNDAVDWLLNSRHTADPDIQEPFWARVEGYITSRELRDEALDLSQIRRRVARTAVEGSEHG